MQEEEEEDVWAVFGSDSSTEDKEEQNDYNDDTGVVADILGAHPDLEVFVHHTKYGMARGKGVRCRRSYKAGEEIMRESATICIPNLHQATSRQKAQALHLEDLRTAFDALPLETQRSVMDLSICAKHDNNNNNHSRDSDHRLKGIYQTNSFRLLEENGEQTFGGLFLTTARINHACRPNVSHFWRPDLQSFLLFATRDIDTGDELSLCYLPHDNCGDTQSRRDFLRKGFSFHCMCDMCVEGNSLGGDDRMVELAHLMNDLPELAGGIRGRGDSQAAAAALRIVERCLVLLKEQRLDYGGFTKNLLSYGYQLATKDDVAQDYLERELAAVVGSEGEGCPNSLRLLELRTKS